MSRTRQRSLLPLEHFSYYCELSRFVYVQLFLRKSRVDILFPVHTYRENAPRDFYQ